MKNKQKKSKKLIPVWLLLIRLPLGTVNWIYSIYYILILLPVFIIFSVNVVRSFYIKNIFAKDYMFQVAIVIFIIMFFYILINQVWMNIIRNPLLKEEVKRCKKESVNFDYTKFVYLFRKSIKRGTLNTKNYSQYFKSSTSWQQNRLLYFSQKENEKVIKNIISKQVLIEKFKMEFEKNLSVDKRLEFGDQGLIEIYRENLKDYKRFLFSKFENDNIKNQIIECNSIEEIAEILYEIEMKNKD
ncbi:hypothetical protein [Mycoplasma procyoni]|uniref:hypothetical protein n=1 Tax=Mycoplasma procyoni TaxID=568784 RepID=UPI00197B527B|nr:hypothetical protein [Mycoplasma procyoni]MBN3534374.1 hypothetical protein [Mycoplasma procyoni]